MRKYNVLVSSSFMIMLILAIFGMISAMSGTGGNDRTEETKLDSEAVRIIEPDTVFEAIETQETEGKAETETGSETASAERDTASNAPSMDDEKTAYYSVPLSEELQDHIFELGEMYGIPPVIIIAIISRESNFNEGAIGAEGEIGYMQIHPVTASYIMNNTGLDISDPIENISAGAWLLHYFLSQGYSLNDALICYNEGEGNAAALFSQGIYSTAYTEDIYSISDALIGPEVYE